MLVLEAGWGGVQFCKCVVWSRKGVTAMPAGTKSSAANVLSLSDSLKKKKKPDGSPVSAECSKEGEEKGTRTK